MKRHIILTIPMDDERLVTRLLLKFSDKRRGWVVVRRQSGRLALTEFVRAFEAFIETETDGDGARRLRRNFSYLRKTIVRCIDAWNRARARNGVSSSDNVRVDVIGDQLTNVALVRRRAQPRHRRRTMPTSLTVSRTNIPSLIEDALGKRVDTSGCP